MEEKELFIEYEKLYKEYKEAKKEYEKALNKKAEYLYSILPGANKSDGQGTFTFKISNKPLNYTIQITEIEKEIEVRRNLQDNILYRLKLKELELRDSKNILDKIYVMRFIDRIKVRHIAYKINYSTRQTYRIIEELKEKTR